MCVDLLLWRPFRVLVFVSLVAWACFVCRSCPFVSQPRGGGGRGRGRGRGRGAQPVAADDNATPHARGVTAAEYRMVLCDGAGVPAGLLPDGNRLLGACGTWRFQQDGAPAHTMANTAEGNSNRALIERFATPVEPWPAHSPDLSPIEKAWSRVESAVWETKTWDDITSFKAALIEAWEEVVTPAYCRRLFGGIRATYATCAQLDGALVRGWGRRCAAKLDEESGRRARAMRSEGRGAGW